MRPHAPAREMQSRRKTRGRRGWFSGFGALGKIGDLLQALLAVSEKDVAGKVAGDECFLTTIRPTGKLWGLGKVTGMKHGHKKLLARFYETESFMAVLRDVLDKFLPDDVHIRSNGRVRGKNDSPPLTIQLILTY
ncbi:hypothetical protein CK203_045417 [Vitis vinifera]|uniref:Uncharacterized protein n=1 Tax=Vitis vinifera TaxID=29760 RepID=A0A438H9R7_VITVI|nr:hypothetical protein CK203_045417 [Vitis vinifera]